MFYIHNLCRVVHRVTCSTYIIYVGWCIGLRVLHNGGMIMYEGGTYWMIFYVEWQAWDTLQIYIMIPFSAEFQQLLDNNVL